MADKYLVGGAGLTEFYDVTYNSETSTYTVGATPVFSLTEIMETKADRQEDGTIKLSYTQLEDTEALETFLTAYALPPADSTGTLAEKNLENGAKRGGGSATGKTVLAVSYGAANNETTKKRKMTFAFGSIASTSGSWTQKYNESTDPTFDFVGMKNDKKAITVPITAVNEDYAKLAAAFDIPLNKSYMIKHLPLV